MPQLKPISVMRSWLSWLCLLSLFLTAGELTAQSSGGSVPTEPEAILLRAEQQLSRKDTSGALLEFERYLFFANPKNAPEIRLRMGLLFKAQGNFSRASAEFAEGISYLGGDELYYRLRYEKGLCEFLRGNDAAALREFQVVWNEAKTDSIRSQAGMLTVISQNNLFRWDAAEKMAGEIWGEESEFFISLQSEYQKVKKQKFKSRTTAIVLSALLPGTGQWYGGKFWRGLLSTFLILSFAGLTVLAAIWGRWILAFLTPFSLFQRFYSGGIKYADTLVRLHNQNLKIRQAQKLNEMILKKGK